MKNDSCNSIPIKTALLVVGLCVISYFLFDFDEEATAVLCKMLIVVTCSFLLGRGVSYHDKTEETTDDAITKEKIKSWVKESVNETVQINADEYFTSQLGAINRQICKMDKNLHKDLEEVFITKNSKLIFLQELAHSIGKEGKAWDEEQVARFMVCLNKIVESLDTEIKHSSDSATKSQQSTKGNAKESESV